jgi:hypothetical protein
MSSSNEILSRWSEEGGKGKREKAEGKRKGKREKAEGKRKGRGR